MHRGRGRRCGLAVLESIRGRASLRFATGANHRPDRNDRACAATSGNRASSTTHRPSLLLVTTIVDVLSPKTCRSPVRATTAPPTADPSEARVTRPESNAGFTGSRGIRAPILVPVLRFEVERVESSRRPPPDDGGSDEDRRRANNDQHPCPHNLSIPFAKSGGWRNTFSVTCFHEFCLWLP
ncbi:MAG: hypothetical protein JWP01_3782 [Myxococcales bacterium]|nr:hypothetical protein [Myxococcales bacterium]